jgi:hypothetical protein
MHNRELVLRPALLHSRRLDNVPALLVHVQLNELIVLLLFGATVGDHVVELLLMQSVHIANVSEPGVQKAHVLWCHGGFDTTAAIVAAYDNVLNFEVADRVVYDGHDVEVDVVYEVGNVAVDEHLAWFETCDGFGGDAGVGAAFRYSISKFLGDSVGR